ncbi:Photosystem I P700 chlorophyll a apoprotein A1 [Acorus gramineus]|uniref:Photosystem I P700 chlorophyll a apoprotein A1 n=1 Tax=Acorus gramineus TaxID=55184 RepID=A0AAV9B4A4_ACOGR|nr:Photosystem I P700 chlorophyll a apoprotein A1 [Acorus gramineus]
MSWHVQLAVNLAIFGSLIIVLSHHMYSMPIYIYIRRHTQYRVIYKNNLIPIIFVQSNI